MFYQVLGQNNEGVLPLVLLLKMKLQFGLKRLLQKFDVFYFFPEFALRYKCSTAH